MFHGGLDLDLVNFCKSLCVQIKMSNCAKKCMRAVGWTGLRYVMYVLDVCNIRVFHVKRFVLGYQLPLIKYITAPHQGQTG